MRAARWGAAVLTAFACVAHALDPERAVGDFYHVGWTVKEGAPGQISAMAQSRDGYLWLATQSGLFHFDGVAFDRFEPAGPDAFASDAVSALFATASGSLWVGFRYGGASVVHANGVRTFTEADGFSTGSVFAFAESRDGTTWVATYQGLMRRRNDAWEWVRGETWGLEERQARAVLVDRDDTTWVATSDSLYTLAPGAERFRLAGSGIGLTSQLAQAPDGAIWIAESDGAVRRASRDADGATTPPVMIAVAAVSLLFDRDGSLWVGTSGSGVHRYPYPERLVAAATPGAVAGQSFNEPDGLTADYVGPALEDREGNVWFGTARGLDRMRAARFVPAGLPAGSFDFALVAGEGGVVWAGTRNRPLMRVQVPLVTPTALDQPVSSAIRDRQGVIWLGGPRGIWRLDGERPVPVATLPPRAPNSAVQAMTVDTAGALWVSLNVPGVFRFGGGEWTHIEREPGLVERASPLVALTDRAGRVWFGYSRNRITRVEDGRMRRLGAADGLEVGNVTALSNGSRGVWIGGERGLATERGGRFRQLTAKDDTALIGITGLIERENGDLWLNGSRGVVQVPADEVRRSLDDPAHRMVTGRFDYLDGLPGTPAQFRPLPTAVESSDGRLWFSTTSGVVWLDPDRIARNPLPPPVVIHSVQFGDRAVVPSQGLRVPPRTASVRIQYTAASLAIPERVRFRYRLEGLDEGWREAGTRREASFDYLPPGEYRFRVAAANDDGVWNEQGAALDFMVEPTFAQTWWFRALGVAAAIALLWALYMARVHQLSERIRLRARERHLERERIARELHDTLLQSVQGLILRFQVAVDAAPDPRTRAVLGTALDRADSVLAEGRDRVRDLRASADARDDLRHALDDLGRDLAQGHASAFHVEQAGDARPLAPLVQDEVYHVGREALINAFRHAQAKQIVVELQYAAEHFRLCVKDDGRGIAPAVMRAGGREGHWGLTGMRERARRLGGEHTLRSAADTGTEVVLTVAAATAYGDRQRPARWRWFRRGPP